MYRNCFLGNDEKNRLKIIVVVHDCSCMEFLATSLEILFSNETSYKNTIVCLCSERQANHFLLLSKQNFLRTDFFFCLSLESCSSILSTFFLLAVAVFVVVITSHKKCF